jgi:hypothetical protein
MTSAIVYNTITTNYPVAGQDNDTQGFRDNFTAIRAGLAKAAAELTALQTNGIDVTKTENNLQGSTLYNGLYNQLSGTYLPVTQSANNVPNYDTMTADFTMGSVQQFNLKYNTQINFSNWPVNNTPVGASYYSTLKLILTNISNPMVGVAVNFGGLNGATVKVAQADSLLNQSGSNGSISLAPVTALSTVAITGVGGVFSCATTTLAVGQAINVTGTNTGTGSITGYVSGTIYYIITTNGTTQFQLSTSPGGSAVQTTVGTPIGLVFSPSTTYELDAWTVNSGLTVFMKLSNTY